MKRSVAVLTIAAAVSLLAFTPSGHEQERAAIGNHLPPSKTSEGIVARGRIEPRGGVIVVSGPPESLSTVAIVDKLLVGPGDKIVPGQILAIINGYELALADHAVAAANLQVARLQRSQLQAGVGKTAEIAAQANVLAARRAQLIRAEKEWGRATALVQKNSGSIQVLDTQKANFDQLTQEVEQAQNALKALTEVRAVDDALAAGQVSSAEANLARSQTAMERLQVRARASGTVLSIQAHAGEVIGADGILRLGDLDHLIVVAEIDHGQAHRVRSGMAASIEGGAISGSIPGTVTHVAREIYRQKRPSSDILVGRDARVIEVDITPDRPLPPVIGAEIAVRLNTTAAER